MRIGNSFMIGTHRFFLSEQKCLPVSSFWFNTWYFSEFMFIIAMSGFGSLTAVPWFACFHFIQLGFRFRCDPFFGLWETLSLFFVEELLLWDKLPGVFINVCLKGKFCSCLSYRSVSKVWVNSIWGDLTPLGWPEGKKINFRGVMVTVHSNLLVCTHLYLREKKLGDAI